MGAVQGVHSLIGKEVSLVAGEVGEGVWPMMLSGCVVDPMSLVGDVEERKGVRWARRPC